MAKNKSSVPKIHPADVASPFEDLVYRAMVFTRMNGDTPLYFVAGLQGGPWKAFNALTHSHKVHGGQCFYCRETIPPGTGTIDHVEPQCRGGKGMASNLVLACKPCNAAKGHRVIDLHNPKAGKQWLEAVLRQIQERLDRLELD